MSHRECSSTQGSTVGLGRPARVLTASEEPPLGAHLVTPRRAYTHHGIYVGHGRVVHYKSALLKLWRSPVEEDSLERFALGRPIWVHIHAAPRFDAAEVANRARSRLGQNRYRLFTNNCEHLCEWCVQDEPRSYQVERLLNLTRWLPRVVGLASTALMSAAEVPD